MDGMLANGLEDSPAEGSPSDSNATLHHCIGQLARRLPLCQTDRIWASELVNDLRDKFLEYLKHNTHSNLQSPTVLNTGSYYEMVKIGDPDEFDMMLLIETPRLEWKEIDQLNGVFYKVSLIKPTRKRIQPFLLQDNLTISPSKVLEETRRLVCKFIKSYKAPGGKHCWTLNRKNHNSPAITLLLKSFGEEDTEREGEEEQDTREQISLDIVPALEVSDTQGWPLATRKGLDVEKWLGRKTRRNLTSQGFYFVAKKPKKLRRNLSPDAEALDTERGDSHTPVSLPECSPACDWHQPPWGIELKSTSSDLHSGQSGVCKAKTRAKLSLGLRITFTQVKENQLISMESWRISFSHIEKQIITIHGNNRTCCEKKGQKCCRKQCLKLLKYLIERLKQLYPNDLKPLCSYHAKTVFLHTLSARAEDQQWALKLLPECFLLLLGKLEDHVHDASLPHFFVPGHNLFAHPDFPRRNLQFLQKTLEDQRMQGYPLLREAQPVKPLSTTDGTTPKHPRSPAPPPSDSSIKNAVCFSLLLGFIMFLYSKF